MTLAILQRPESADDFRAFYRAAEFSRDHAGVYSRPFLFPDYRADRQFLPYIRIPSYAAILQPLTSLPYPAARAVWLSASVLAFFACICLTPEHRSRFAMGMAFSLPVAYAFVLGQDIGFVLLIAIAAARVFAMQREFIAGLIASLVAIKVSYLPAVGLVFLAKTKRGTAGLALGAGLQLAASFALAGTRWPIDYLALLRSPLFDTEPRRMPNVRAIATSLGLPDATYLIAAAILFLLLWFACQKLTLPDALTLALPVALIASPHCYVYDAVVLIPLFVRVGSLPALIGLSPIGYLLLMTERPVNLLAGALIVVTVTLVSAVEFYRDAAGFPMRITGSDSPLSSGTPISSIAS
jgi:hypothetical protein